jgi:hypothetical protein
MNSFQETYCAATGCSPPRFRTRIFWRCLNPVAAFIAPLLGGPSADFFSADRDLIAQVGRATSMERIHEEVRDYFHDPRNRSWLRRRLKLRLSTARLRSLAQAHLAPGAVDQPP